jgi:hypothetical protein
MAAAEVGAERRVAESYFACEITDVDVFAKMASWELTSTLRWAHKPN